MDYNNFVQPAIWAAVVIASLAALRLANIFIYIPNNQVGIVEKLWTTRGSIKAGFIALRGEAGFEPEVLRGGLHLFFPFMYRIHRSDLVTVGQGKIAYVFAREGAPLGRRRCSAPTIPRTSRISRTHENSFSGAARKARSENFSARALTRSTPPSLPSSPTSASTGTR